MSLSGLFLVNQVALLGTCAPPVGVQCVLRFSIKWLPRPEIWNAELDFGTASQIIKHPDRRMDGSCGSSDVNTPESRGADSFEKRFSRLDANFGRRDPRAAIAIARVRRTFGFGIVQRRAATSKHGKPAFESAFGG